MAQIGRGGIPSFWRINPKKGGPLQHIINQPRIKKLNKNFGKCDFKERNQSIKLFFNPLSFQKIVLFWLLRAPTNQTPFSPAHRFVFTKPKTGGWHLNDLGYFAPMQIPGILLGFLCLFLVDQRSTKFSPFSPELLSPQ